MNRKEVKVLICGAGSIGIFLGAKIKKKGYDVCLFGRRKLKNAGEKEVYINGKKYDMPLRVFSIPKNTRYDFVFLTCKLYDMPKIVSLIKKSKIKSKILINVQNGLVDNSKFEKMLGKKILPICVFGGFKIEDNKIKSSPTKIGWLTEYSGNGKEISSFVSSCNIKCKAEKKFDSYRAEKMLINCCLNGLSAIEKKPFNELFSSKQVEDRINKLFEESYEILKKRYPLDNKELLKKRMVKNWSKVNHYSSTYQDVISGRKSEISFFNGYLKKLGHIYHVKTNENNKVLQDFKGIK